MSIKYEPSKLIKKIAPEKKIKRLLSSKVTLKKTALSFLDDVPNYLSGVISKADVAAVALKTVKGYQQRIAQTVVAAGFDRKAGAEEKSEIVDDPKQLIQRVQNEVVLQISGEIKDRYEGESYTWLPSDADEPDPEHQLNYGKKFRIGVGEMPGERYGCRCGMEIHVNEKQLNLQE